MQHFTELAVWKKAHQLALDVYRTTQAFPRGELSGLTTQLRRAAGSITANIAEGRGRMTDGEFARFLRYSLGSATEIECHLLLARDLCLLPLDRHDRLASDTREVQRMLASLIRRIQRDVTPNKGQRLTAKG